MIDKESYNRLIDERGFLTADGRRYVDERFGREVDTLLKMGFTANQKRIIASVLKNYIGEKVLDAVKDVKAE